MKAKQKGTVVKLVYIKKNATLKKYVNSIIYEMRFLNYSEIKLDHGFKRDVLDILTSNK